jgi:hypothetical protein
VEGNGRTDDGGEELSQREHKVLAHIRGAPCPGLGRGHRDFSSFFNSLTHTSTHTHLLILTTYLSSLHLIPPTPHSHNGFLQDQLHGRERHLRLLQQGQLG